jgi:hypothetical protein
MERRRGTGEAAAPYDRHEGLDVVELHAPISIANDPPNIYAFDS